MLTFLVFSTIEPGLSLPKIYYEVSKKGRTAAEEYAFRGIPGEAKIIASLKSISKGKGHRTRKTLLSLLKVDFLHCFVLSEYRVTRSCCAIRT